MATSKVFIGAQVLNKKGQQGEIVRIITKSTGYVEVSYGSYTSKEMAFNLTDLNGVALRKAPAAPKAAVKTLSPVEELKFSIFDRAKISRNDSFGFEWGYESLYRFLEQISKLDCFAANIANTVLKSIGRYFIVAYISEKQAYYLAAAAIENNITL